MDAQVRKHNATYLRNVADLIESGEYEMHGTGGASVEGDDIVVFIDAVFKPTEKAANVQEPA